MANFIKSYPKMAVTLEGHTDNKGAERYNLKLSQSRASIVKDILVNHYGIQAIRLSSVGYGESMPIDTNNTGRDRQNNRRVVASYLLTKTTNQVNS
jgi:outer membrane protein OmpA-like peptidoglycan-associated protein